MSFAAKLPADSHASKVSSSLLSDGLWTLLLRGFSAALAFFVHMLMANYLGAEQFGEYAVALCMSQISSVVFLFGLHNVAVKFASAYLAQSQFQLLKSCLRYVFSRGAMAVLACSAILLMIAYSSSGKTSTGVNQCLYLASLMAPMLLITLILEALLRGFSNIVTSSLTSSIRFSCFILTIVALRAMNVEFNSLAALSVHIICAAMAIIYPAVVLKKSIHKIPSSSHENSVLKNSPSEINAWNSVAAVTGFAAVICILQAQSGTLCIWLFHGTEQSGIYAAIEQLSASLLFGLTSFNMAVAPRFTTAYSRNDFQALQHAAKTCTAAGSLFALLIGGIMFLFGHSILGIYGSEFTTGNIGLNLLCLGVLVNAMCGPVDILLNMTGEHRLVTRVMTFCLLIHGLLIAFLTPRFGVTGTSLAVCISMCLWNAVLSWFVYQRFKITTFASPVYLVRLLQKNQAPAISLTPE